MRTPFPSSRLGTIVSLQLRAADSCAGVSFALNVPGGCRALHAAPAFFHTAGLTLTP
jgi:hypothetical protein